MWNTEAETTKLNKTETLDHLAHVTPGYKCNESVYMLYSTKSLQQTFSNRDMRDWSKTDIHNMKIFKAVQLKQMLA